MADVPGLIEGASEGVGLGHEFLAHLERARLLVHVIDASEGDADERFATIDRRARALRRGPGRRDRRSSCSTSPTSSRARRRSRVDDERILGRSSVSCATGEGIDALKRALFALCPAAPDRVEEDRSCPSSSTTGRRRRAARVPHPPTDRGFRVVGEPPDEDELEEALRAAGVRRGAQVEIGDEVLEWQP